MANMSAAYLLERAWAETSASSGPSRVRPRSREDTSRSAETYPESTACSPGSSPARLQVVVHGCGHRHVRHRRVRGLHVGDQVRQHRPPGEHDNPAQAKSDGANALDLKLLPQLLDTLMALQNLLE